MKRFSFLRNASLIYASFPKVVSRNIRLFFSKTMTPENKTMKFTLVGASVGALVGVGYSGYTHYVVNKTPQMNAELLDSLLLKELPSIEPTRKVVNSNYLSNLQLVLFQYQTCPFCCKVRAFLDYKGISYDVVEVDAVLRQSIKWSKYKKVPILLAKTDDGFQQLNDSSVIISALSSYLVQEDEDITAILKYYPTLKYAEGDGSTKEEIANKYFIMKKDQPINELTLHAESNERKWRKWADSVLVHTLSPNVYRTLGEAFQTFNWFADVGMWHENFPKWEVNIMVNVGAVAMWMISKKLRKRHGLKGDVRQSLYDECNYWTSNIKGKDGPFMGGEHPDLSDLATYGILNSIEGCIAFADLREHTSIGTWYDKMKYYVACHNG